MRLWRHPPGSRRPPVPPSSAQEDWIAGFAPLQRLDASDRADLIRAARVLRLPAGAAPFSRGAPCEHYILIVAGTVRVQMIGESGREIVLYRVGQGETCILTTSCLLAGQDYPAEAITETEVVAAIVAGPAFHDLLARSAIFRDFVFQSFGRRLADLMVLVEEVAFRRIDARLAGLLLERAGPGGALASTHQDLAIELGSAREVISRQLKDFERRGLVALQRGHVRIIDADGLRAVAARATIE